jgi:hypothetical protein
MTIAISLALLLPSIGAAPQAVTPRVSDGSSSPGLRVSSVRFSADGAVTGLYIDGVEQPLGSHADDWTRADEYGQHASMRSLAVSATAAGGVSNHAGLVGVIELADGRWVPTDRTWRAWSGTGEPPVDAAGRPWHHPDYDDGEWSWATELGPYGSAPWGTEKAGPRRDPPTSRLDADMRRLGPIRQRDSGDDALTGPMPAGTSVADILALQRRDDGHSVRAADWIWAGPGFYPANHVYMRKSLVGGHGTPPSRPSGAKLLSVDPTGFELAWQPSFAPQGPVRYKVVWNGLAIAETSETHYKVDGLSINPLPQNYVMYGP